MRPMTISICATSARDARAFITAIAPKDGTKGGLMNLTRTQRTTQQIEWLGELYPRLIRVAQAIIPESITIAEDLTSDAVAVILQAVTRGRCTIIERSRFSSYCKNMVRKKARNAYTDYTGDLRTDKAKVRVIRKMRPDRRRTVPRRPEDLGPNPYERWETLDSIE